MNDEKYMNFNERIQNTLLKPEILKYMSQSNTGTQEQRQEFKMKLKQKKEEEKKMSHDELIKRRQKEHEERKRQKIDGLRLTDQDLEVFEDSHTKQERTAIQSEKEKFMKSVQVLNDDKKMQKDAILKKLAERRKKLANNKSKISNSNSIGR